MDMRRFLDLYITETQEHLRTLSRSLLALESGSADAVGEAFRSAHTIKGLSAAMGYSAVAGMAHVLEDTLQSMRDGALTADAALIDSLLREADALDQAVHHAVTTIEPQVEAARETQSTSAAGSAAASAIRDVPLPAGTSRVTLVRIREDAQIKSARAMLIMRGLDGNPALLGAHPTSWPDDFDGVIHLFFTNTVDETAVRDIIMRAGDVASIEFMDPAPQPPIPTVQLPQRSAPKPRAVRHVRVDEARLDGVQESLGELSILQNRLQGDASAMKGAADIIERMQRLIAELQIDVLTMRMVPLSETFERLPRVVRDAARTCGKDVDFTIEGDAIELDRSILNELGDPLVHMLRNSVDHGIETPEQRIAAGKPPRGRLLLRAERERNSVRVVLEDDGRGVDRARVVQKALELGLITAAAHTVPNDEEVFRLLAHPGFSTAEKVTEVSGRGVGLDAVVNRVRSIGGSVEMHSVDGQGTTFVIRLPISLALAQALRVRVAGEDYAIPLTHLSEAIELHDALLVPLGNRESVRVRDDVIPLIRLRHVLGADSRVEERAAVITELGDRRVALAVDELVGRQQILVKNFDSAVGTLPYFSGATLLDDGKPALVLDPLSVM
ncbi:MAG: chemotaxis protein CheA [Longimicrobiales bacterium]